MSERTLWTNRYENVKDIYTDPSNIRGNCYCDPMDTTATRPRGRPRKFDEEEVLNALTELFWRQGYESTSMTDVVETSGMNKSSLYNTFGSKHDLFTRILDRYIDARMGTLDSMVAHSGDGMEGLHAFLEFIRLEVATDMGRHGCMAVNTSAELGGVDSEMVDFAERYRGRMSGAVRLMMERAAANGQLDITEIDHHTDMLTMFMLGISLTVRSGAGEEEIGRFIDAAHASVESWRI